MTPAQTNEYQRFLAIAAKEQIRIIGKGVVKETGQVCYSVSSSKGKTAYIVAVAGSSLVCECPAKGYCKHRALTRHTMILAADKSRQLEQEQEADRIAAEVLTGQDVYAEPIIAQPPQGPRLTR